MSRYYILSDRDGLKIIEASAVDEADPLTVRFIGKTTTTFHRHDLLWWNMVESAPQPPFASFGAARVAPSRRYPTFGSAHEGWKGHDTLMHDAQTKADHGRRSAAAMRVLVEAVRSGMPDSWQKAALELKVCFELPSNRYRITHRLRHPDAGAEAMDFSDGLFAAIDVFHRIAVEGGENWNQSTLTVELDEKKRCLTAEVSHAYGTNFGPR